MMRPPQLVRDELLELRLWLEDTREEARLRWWKRRWRVFEIVDAAAFELGRLRTNRLARGLAATAILAVGGAAATLAGGSGTKARETATASASPPARPAALHAPASPKHLAKPKHHAKPTPHRKARPARRHRRRAAPHPAQAVAVARVAPAAPAPPARQHVVVVPPPAPVRHPAPRRPAHHGGGPAVSFDSSG